MHIGVFDSGFGGLTILKELRRIMPEYSYLYLGDNLRAPYGDRTPERIIELTHECVEELFNRDCSIVVMACNSSSAIAMQPVLDSFCQKYSGRNLFGVIEPVVEAIETLSTAGGRAPYSVGLIGTRATIRSRGYSSLLAVKGLSNISLFEKACPLLVPLIEEGMLRSSATRKILRSYLKDLKSKNLDALIMGCTHYPMLTKEIRGIMGLKVLLLNQGVIMAQWLNKFLLSNEGIRSGLLCDGGVEFFTTGNAEHFNSLAGRFWKRSVKATEIK